MSMTTGTNVTFTVLRGVTSAGPWTVVASGLTTTTYVDTGLNDGQEYWYQIEAVNSYGASAPSTPVSAVPSIITVPGVPTNFTVSPGNARAVLDWAPPAGSAPTGYYIYRLDISDTTPYKTLTALTFTDTGLTNGMLYSYRVGAFNSAGSGLQTVTVSVVPASTSVPSAPTNLVATSGSNATIPLTWNTPASAGSSPITSYNVYVGSTSGGESTTPYATGIAASATSYTVTDLVNGDEYFLTIAAVSTAGVGTMSAEVSATPQSAGTPLPGAPTHLVATSSQNAEVPLSWTAPTTGGPVVSYNILRNTVSGQELLVYTGVTGTTFTDTGSAVAPGVPGSFAVVPGNGEVAVTWVTSTGVVDHYDVYYGTSSPPGTGTLVGPLERGYTITGLTNGTEYYFSVVAVNGAGVAGTSILNATPTSGAVTYIVTYNYEGGTGSPATATYSGTPLTLPTPTYAGHTFDGWFTSATGGTRVNSPYTPTANITLYAQWTASSGSSVLLSMSGRSIQQNGSRFIIKGVALESYDDPGGGNFMSNQLPLMPQIITKMKSLGINAVRMAYLPSYVNSGSNFTNFCSMMTQLTNAGLYIMPGDWSYTGKPISNYTTISFPTFQAVINYANAHGFIDYMMYNPYNEPYSDNSSATQSAWLAANEATVAYFRNTLGYRGILVLDGPEWAIVDDTNLFDSMLAYDTTLLGTPNLIFSNHYYPSYNFTTAMGLAATYPLIIGEMGQYNNGATNSSYPPQVFASLLSTGIPNGHNGAFPWIWWWSDGNTITSDGTTLTTYGNLVNSDFWTQVTN